MGADPTVGSFAFVVQLVVCQTVNLKMQVRALSLALNGVLGSLVNLTGLRPVLSAIASSNLVSVKFKEGS